MCFRCAGTCDCLARAARHRERERPPNRVAGGESAFLAGKVAGKLAFQTEGGIT